MIELVPTGMEAHKRTSGFRPGLCVKTSVSRGTRTSGSQGARLSGSMTLLL